MNEKNNKMIGVIFIINLIDTHAHYNSSIMDDLEEEIKIANNNKDVSKIVNVGLDNKISEE